MSEMKCVHVIKNHVSPCREVTRRVNCTSVVGVMVIVYCQSCACGGCPCSGVVTVAMFLCL